MFSRIKVFFILLLFIQSRIVYGVNIHYCGNHIANLSYLYDAEGCEMHNPKYGKNHYISQKTCCYDKVLFYDKNQLETESKIIFIYNPVVEKIFFAETIFLNKFIISTIPEFPPPKLHAYKKNCAFIFYG